MQTIGFDAGLTLRIPSPSPGALEPDIVITEEAGVLASPDQRLRVSCLVKEGDVVAQGAPLACLRDAPEIRFVAPMAGRVASIDLLPGHRLSQIVVFRERGGDTFRHPVAGANTEAGLLSLMRHAGIWPWLRRRPFGGMPGAAERPAAIVVMAADTRPFAPDPRRALAGRAESFARGLAALARLTDGPVFVCARPGPALFDRSLGVGRIRAVACGARHPQGLPGIRIHDLAPAAIDAPVWDLHAEDVAALGDLLETGVLPMARLVSVAGTALREGRMVHTQPGADLRELTYRVVAPGPHVLLSGSPLDGYKSQWLAPRDRQVSVMPRPVAADRPHWLVSALTRSARAKPIIPTAALAQAFGHALPAAPFLRALGAGDDETAMKLGVLSLLEEDVALADYALGGEAHLGTLLRGLLERVRSEFAA